MIRISASSGIAASLLELGTFLLYLCIFVVIILKQNSDLDFNFVALIVLVSTQRNRFLCGICIHIYHFALLLITPHYRPTSSPPPVRPLPTFLSHTFHCVFYSFLAFDYRLYPDSSLSTMSCVYMTMCEYVHLNLDMHLRGSLGICLS